jgi:hypothetical protein
VTEEVFAALAEAARFPLADARRPAVNDLLDGLLVEADLVNSRMEAAAAGSFDLIHPVPRPEEDR